MARNLNDFRRILRNQESAFSFCRAFSRIKRPRRWIRATTTPLQPRRWRYPSLNLVELKHGWLVFCTCRASTSLDHSWTSLLLSFVVLLEGVAGPIRYQVVQMTSFKAPDTLWTVLVILAINQKHWVREPRDKLCKYFLCKVSPFLIFPNWQTNASCTRSSSSCF